MTAAELAGRILGARDNGAGQWCGHCPNHEDRRASLSWRDGDRSVLVKCHAGCAVEAITAAVGLRVGELFYDAEPDERGRRRQVAVYDFRDEVCTLLFQVVRYTPKDFRQRRPDGRGGWVWNLDGVRRVLYRLAEIQRQGTVYVVEGERDAEALAALGIPATTNPGGAGKWAEDYTEQLKAAGVRQVVILPDNDPPGEAHAQAVARSCFAAGVAVKMIQLPGLPAKGDVSDWLGEGHPREELARVVKAAPLVTLAALEPATVKYGGEDRPVLIRLSDVAPESVSWLWRGRLAQGKLTLLAGDPGLGKSFITLDVASRISMGREWPDGGEAPRGDTILLSAEDGAADTIRPRVDALGGDASKVHLLRAVRRNDAEQPFCLAADLPALERAIRETGAVLLVIDPLSAYLGKTDSYKDAEVRGLLAPLAAIAEQHKIGVMVVMHLTKDSQRRAIHRAGGSIGFVGAARVVLAVGKDAEDEERRLLVPVKTNLSSPPAALAYRIIGRSAAAASVEWEPEPAAGIEADALLGPATLEDREERREADELLRDQLADGERPAVEVQQAARANGISDRTLNRAKRRLGVKARHMGQPGRRQAWYWSLPDPDWSPKVATEPPKVATSPHVATLEQGSEETVESARTSPKVATSAHMATFGGNLRESGNLRASEEVDPWVES
jgi:putative DNA primase/helicase